MQNLLFNTYARLIETLYDRWEDEKEYEDFGDYILNVKKFVKAKGHEFVSLTKRPFVLTVRVEGEECLVKATSTQLLISTP